MNIKYSDNEVLITGSKDELLELAEYITKVANSNNEKDHLHLDDLTIVDKDSEVKNLIIEKI